MKRKNNPYLVLILIIISFISCRKDRVIFDSKPNSELEMPLLLNINGAPALLDADLKLFKYSLNIDSCDFDTFSGVVEFSEDSEIWYDGKKMTRNQSFDFGDPKPNVPHDLKIKTHGEEFEFKFYFTNLHLMQVATLNPIRREPKALARIKLMHSFDPTYNMDSYIGIEKRGNSSAMVPKSPYGFAPLSEFNTESETSIGFIELAACDSWVLNPMARDYSHMRNKVAFQIWNEISGIPKENQLSTELVELFINNEQQGFYHLYQKYSAALLGYTSESILINGSKGSLGNRFLEIDNSIENRYWNGWRQFYPNPNDELRWDEFQAMSEIIVNGSPEALKNDLPQILDIDNVVSYFLLLQVTDARDNNSRNWLFSKKNAASKFMILPWDLDTSFGRNGKGEIIEPSGIITNGLFNKLLDYNVDGFKTKVKQRWNELRLTTFSEANVEKLFRDNFEQVEKSGVVNWDNSKWDMNTDLQTEAEYIYLWLKFKLPDMDEKINAL